jgi:hypothetical protein
MVSILHKTQSVDAQSKGAGTTKVKLKYLTDCNTNTHGTDWPISKYNKSGDKSFLLTSVCNVSTQHFSVIEETERKNSSQ